MNWSFLEEIFLPGLTSHWNILPSGKPNIKYSKEKDGEILLKHGTKFIICKYNIVCEKYSSYTNYSYSSSILSRMRSLTSYKQKKIEKKEFLIFHMFEDNSNKADCTCTVILPIQNVLRQSKLQLTCSLQPTWDIRYYTTQPQQSYQRNLFH